jgi:carbamoyltransferase
VDTLTVSEGPVAGVVHHKWDGVRTGDLVVGISGARQNAAVAACVDGTLVGACEQERLTRRRRVGVRPGLLPEEAVEAVLRLAGNRPITDVRQFATAEDALALPSHVPALRFAHHFAHAATAFYLSPFASASVLVCDQHSSPAATVWAADGTDLRDLAWPCGATSLAGLYSEASRLFGFGEQQEQRIEALARLSALPGEARFAEVIRYEDGAVWASSRWRTTLSDWLSEDLSLAHRVHVAGAFQHHLGEMLLKFAADIRSATERRHICLGGGLFFNTYFTTLVRQSGLFEDVFVAPNPGNAGLAVGVALAASGARRPLPGGVNPFLGPKYERDDIKLTLDNCKLSYEYLSDGQVIDVTVDALRKGRLVGWFQERMEWAHRALGNRSILASPLSPYVLDNLNVFLKHRERHRAYGFSVPEEDAPQFFDGPRSSRFMEYEYRLRHGGTLAHAIPEHAQAVRVQTVPDEEPLRRFRDLHRAFAATSGVPVLVNTSFNGFAEPIVCSPRDAIRAFFSTGLDLLVLDRFVIRK